MMGLRRQYHASPLGAAMLVMMMEAMRTNMMRIGYERAELSWILEDNLPMRRIIEGAHGKASKTYRIYEKALT